MKREYVKQIARLLMEIDDALDASSDFAKREYIAQRLNLIRSILLTS